MDKLTELKELVEDLCNPDNFIDGAHRVKARDVIKLLEDSLEDSVLVDVEVLDYIKSTLKDCPDKLSVYPPIDSYETVVVNLKGVVGRIEY